MDNNSNPQIITTGHPVPSTQRPPLPPRPQASYCDYEFGFYGFSGYLKKILKSFFK